MRRLQAFAAVVSILMVSGCTSWPATQKEIQTESKAPVVVITDSFCLTAEKQPWNIGDSPGKIRAARRHNIKIDQCPKRKKS